MLPVRWNCSRLAGLALLVLAAAAAAQAPNPPPAPGVEPAAPAFAEGGGDTTVLPGLVQELPPPTPPRVWASAEYVAWVIGTGKMVEAAKEACNSDLFNALLSASGKNYRDLARTALGTDRTGFRVRAGAWLDQTRGAGVEAAFLYLSRGPLDLSFGNRDASPWPGWPAGRTSPSSPGASSTRASRTSSTRCCSCCSCAGSGCRPSTPTAGRSSSR